MTKTVICPGCSVRVSAKRWVLNMAMNCPACRASFAICPCLLGESTVLPTASQPVRTSPADATAGEPSPQGRRRVSAVLVGLAVAGLSVAFTAGFLLKTALTGQERLGPHGVNSTAQPLPHPEGSIEPVIKDTPVKPATQNLNSVQPKDSDRNLPAARLGDRAGLEKWLRENFSHLVDSLKCRQPEMYRALVSGKLVAQPESGLELHFLYIPPGHCRVGYSDKDVNRLLVETRDAFAAHNASPQVTVTLAEGFFIMDREVTWRQFAGFAKVAGEKARRLDATREDGLDLPVRGVSWQTAMSYCRYLQERTGYVVRLPTEVEWEYAARGPWEQRYPWPDPSEFHGWADKGASSTPGDTIPPTRTFRGVASPI